MKIKILTLECAMCVLGPECAICHQLEKTAGEVVEELGVDASIEGVKDPMAIAQYPAKACCAPGLHGIRLGHGRTGIPNERKGRS